MVKIAGSTPPEDQNFLKWKEPDKIERVQRRNKFTQRTGSNQNIERARKKLHLILSRIDCNIRHLGYAISSAGKYEIRKK